jgi:signal transduction histidine kinase
MRSRGAVADAVVAVLLAWLAAAAALDPPGPAYPGPAWVAWLAGAAVGLPLAVRRRRPLPVLGTVLLAAVAATAVGAVGAGALWATFLPAAVASYTVAVRLPAVPATAALAGALAVPAAAIPWFYAGATLPPTAVRASEVPLRWPVELGITATAVLLAWASGRVVRLRRRAGADAARRLATEAVAAERLRIARELHDVIGHSMSLIAVKATVANHLARERPAEVLDALATIEHTSRAALVEIRHLLGVLRPDAEAVGRPAGPAGLAPAPGVGDLPELAARLRSAGLRVDLEQDAPGLPTGVDLAVYRIVQEASTNVLKHARAGHCRISVRADGGAVRLTVTDDGRAPAPRGRGQGLIGMRERAAVYGGTLTAGPRPDGGFQVAATIPYATAPYAVEDPDD